jgi:hypothetical protein
MEMGSVSKTVSRKCFLVNDGKISLNVIEASGLKNGTKTPHVSVTVGVLTAT